MSVDKNYCMSSFLAFRYIVDGGKDFAPGLHHKHFVQMPEDRKIPVSSAREIDRALEMQFQQLSGEKLGILLSGGMDSAILAAYMPGADAYTFRFVGGEYQKAELNRAEYYAKYYGLKLHYVDIDWQTVLDAVDPVMDTKQSPVHSIEPQIYAGAMQFVGIGLITSGASFITTAFTTFMVNARHLFYSISMVDRYRDAGKYKPYMIFALTDETYTLLADDKAGEDPQSGNLYRFLVSLFDQIYWVTGSVLGSLLGSVLPFSTKGIEFSMTALFIASFTEQWVSGKDRLPALTGVICSFLCLILFGPDQFLIPDMVLITAVLTFARGKLSQNDGEEN